GVVVAGAVFAFIAIIGIVPRLAQKTGTVGSIKIYEEAIIAGGIFGVLTLFFHSGINLGVVIVSFLALCTGIFFGCLAVSLAEVLDVFPISSRRLNLRTGLGFFMVSMALGKIMGSLLYFLVPGFYSD
ncbi:MAG: stage V sporulation protein AB, partial [Clostridiales bacterium]|nr:stage V sporulation protein AB [Clostridiales bacterium]